MPLFLKCVSVSDLATIELFRDRRILASGLSSGLVAALAVPCALRKLAFFPRLLGHCARLLARARRGKMIDLVPEKRSIVLRRFGRRNRSPSPCGMRFSYPGPRLEGQVSK